jgi:hypothetical protein
MMEPCLPHRVHKKRSDKRCNEDVPSAHGIHVGLGFSPDRFPLQKNKSILDHMLEKA